MPEVNIESLKFPTGRSVASARKDAKKLSKKDGISLTEAQNKVVTENGFNLPWDRAIEYLRNIYHVQPLSKPLVRTGSIFYCDVCGEPIESPSDGYVIWNRMPKTHEHVGFKIIHQERCDDRSFLSSLPLERFLGNDGLNYLLSWLSYGPLYPHNTKTNAGLKIVDFDEFVDLARRLQLPLYEEARRYFDHAKSEGLYGDSNPYVPYSNEELIDLVNRASSNWTE